VKQAKPPPEKMEFWRELPLAKKCKSEKTEAQHFFVKNKNVNRAFHWVLFLCRIDTYHQQAVSLLTSLANTSVRRLVAELESGGNVRFEQGFPTDVWYTTCHDLILSRFCAWDYKVRRAMSLKLMPSIALQLLVMHGRWDHLK